MYLPHLHERNLYNDNKLLVFSIIDLMETNLVTYLQIRIECILKGLMSLKKLLKNGERPEKF